MKPSTRGLVKVCLNLTPEADECARSLAAEKHQTVSEVIRRAIVVARFIEDERKRGAVVLLKYPEGDAHQVL